MNASKNEMNFSMLKQICDTQGFDKAVITLFMWLQSSKITKSEYDILFEALNKYIG